MIRLIYELSIKTHQVFKPITAIIACVVLTKSTQKDHGDQHHKEDDHHEGIEDGKPMDLRSMKTQVLE